MTRRLAGGPARPATPAQIAYLAKLGAAVTPGMTVKQASAAIDAARAGRPNRGPATNWRSAAAVNVYGPRY